MAAGRIAAATNAKLLAPYPFTRMERGAGLPVVERMHYVLEQAVEQLKEFRQIILVGSPVPVAYFAYPGKDSVLTPPECVLHTLASPSEDCAGALDALAIALSLDTRSSAACQGGPASIARWRNHSHKAWRLPWRPSYPKTPSW